MRILITGAGGLLGCRFAHWLLEHAPQAEIVGIDDFSCGYRENIPAGVELHELSLGAGEPQMDRLFAGGCDYVFHFAAYAAEGLSPFIRRYNYTNNLLATAEVLNGCLRHGCRRVVFTSSMAVYGPGCPPFDEADDCRPIDPYGIAKRACELDLMVAGEQHGLDWCILRPHNVYGPGQSIWQKYRNVLGHWMSRHLQDLPLLVYGDGLQSRAFSYIDDVLPCLWRAATEPEASRQVINLGGTQPVTVQEAAETLLDVMGGGEIVQAEPRHEVHQAWCTWQKSVGLLGYEDRTGLCEGLERMWAWAQDTWERHPERRGQHVRIPIEVERGLYSYWRQ